MEYFKLLYKNYKFYKIVYVSNFPQFGVHYIENVDTVI